MRAQINFADSSVFRNFMRQMDRLPAEAKAIIHGVFIDIHPTWRRMADIVRITGTPGPYLALEPVYAADYPADGIPGAYDPTPQAMSQELGEAWNHYLTQYKKDVRNTDGSDNARDEDALRAPLVVKVYVLPTIPSTAPVRRLIEDFVQRQPFFGTVEDRPMATLAAINVEGGIRITVTSSGSLGGFLKDQTGKRWGVTCGHVAQNVGDSVTFEDLNSTRHTNAGTVVHTNFPFPTQTKSGLCNPYVNTPSLNNDAALFEVGAGFTPTNAVRSVGTIDKIYDRLQLNSGATIRLGAGRSGAQNYDIGAYGVTCKIQSATAGAYYCFTELFEIHAPVRRPGGRVGQARTPRPRRGDSGSWVCYNYSGSSYAYFGNLIAVQGLTGIATFADSLQAWAQSDHKLDLTVL